MQSQPTNNVDSSPGVKAWRAQQARDSAATTLPTKKDIIAAGLKQILPRLQPEYVSTVVMRAFDEEKSEQQAVQAGRGLGANPRADGSVLERVEERLKTLPELKSTMAPAATTKTAPAADGDILKRMIGACKPSAKDAAAVRRYRLQAAKEEKRKKALDARAKQKAHDDAVAADLLADQKHQAAIDATYRHEWATSRAKQEAAFNRGRDAEPAKSAQIGELSPGGGSFREQTREEGRVQRTSNLHVTKPGRGRTCDPYENYEGNYGPIAARLRGEDAEPRNHDEKFAAECRIARQKLEGR